jgi:hypothetical protein
VASDGLPTVLALEVEGGWTSKTSTMRRRMKFSPLPRGMDSTGASTGPIRSWGSDWRCHEHRHDTGGVGTPFCDGFTGLAQEFVAVTQRSSGVGQGPGGFRLALPPWMIPTDQESGSTSSLSASAAWIRHTAGYSSRRRQRTTVLRWDIVEGRATRHQPRLQAQGHRLVRGGAVQCWHRSGTSRWRSSRSLCRDHSTLRTDGALDEFASAVRTATQGPAWTQRPERADTEHRAHEGRQTPRLIASGVTCPCQGRGRG